MTAAIALALGACSGGQSGAPAGHDSGVVDAPQSDGVPPDASQSDGVPPDASQSDGVAPDASQGDGVPPDASQSDGASPDAGADGPVCYEPTDAGNDSADAGCTKTTCAAYGKNCGVISDNCGGNLFCGNCKANETCGAGCSNVCSCVPKTCAELGKDCGSVPDGCGKMLSCGTCGVGQTCGPNNVCGAAQNILIYANYDGGTFTIDVDKNLPNIGIGILSYQPVTVTIAGQYAANVVGVYVAGAEAGSTVTGVASNIVTIAQNPAATLSDPPWPNTMVCQVMGGALYSQFENCNTTRQVDDFFVHKLGGQVALHACQYGAYTGTLLVSAGGTCTCTPLTCAQAGKNCGSISDGCGGTLSCGTCSNGAVCGGFGTPNVCAGCPAGESFAGPKSPSAVGVDASIGTRTWQNPLNARVSDNQYATVSAMIGGEVSVWLKATDFGFSIPATATIKGVYVQWERSSLSGAGLYDNGVRLVASGTVGSSDRSKTLLWDVPVGGVDPVVLYGGPTDLWGETLTPAVVNASDFGAALSAKYTTVSGNDWPQVDSVKMYVCYQ